MEQKMIRVVEVPGSATAEEMEAALNAPFADGYYLMKLTGGDTIGFRAIYKLRERSKAD